MSDKEKFAVLETAIDTYGAEMQRMVAIEEMAELTKELSKSIRYYSANTKEIAEEIADVEIMLEQLKMIYNNSEQVEEVKAEKIERLAERIKDGGRYENVHKV